LQVFRNCVRHDVLAGRRAWYEYLRRDWQEK